MPANAFNNFQDFSEKFKRTFSPLSARKTLATRLALTEAAKFLQEKAKERFGHYQDGWNPAMVSELGIKASTAKSDYPSLQPSTQQERVRLGYTSDDPLLRDGTLRDSIEYQVYDKRACIGSNNKIMVWQELGTVGGTHIPPRPVIFLTAFENGKEAVEIFAHQFMKNLLRSA